MAQRGRAGASSGMAGQRERLRGVIEPVVNSYAYDLEDLKVSRVGRRIRLQVVIDGDDGVDMEAVARVARGVSTALDEEEETGAPLFAGNPYDLEVSSPGVDRPLTQPRHWRRNVGRLVRVRAADTTVTGRILAASDSGVVLDVNGLKREVPYSELGPGKIQIEFSRPGADDEEPGQGKEEA